LLSLNPTFRNSWRNPTKPIFLLRMHWRSGKLWGHIFH